MNERINLYSSSLYDVAKEEGCEKEVYESLELVKGLLSEHEGYIKIMSSSAIAFSERERLIDEAFGGSVHPFVLNFMKMLSKKRVFEIFIKAAEEFEKTYFKAAGIERATITTAVELSDEKKKEIADRIAKATGKEIIPLFVTDEKILGGILVETENTAIDASLSGKLESIKRYIGKV